MVAGDDTFRWLVRESPDAVLLLDKDSTVRYASRAVERLVGQSPEVVTGRRFSEYLYPEDAERVLQELFAAPESGADGRFVEFRALHADGAGRYLEAGCVRRTGDSGTQAFAVYLRDVTDRKSLEESLAYRALRDSLTGVGNRGLFMDRLGHAVARTARRQTSCAVLFVDVDDFKSVNDNFGHGAGDHLLVTLARRMTACLRPEDTIARLGGDEFAILLEDATSPENVADVAARISDALQAPVEWRGRTLRVTASIGVASSSPQTESPEALLQAADAAMYRIKNRNRTD